MATLTAQGDRREIRRELHRWAYGDEEIFPIRHQVLIMSEHIVEAFIPDKTSSAEVVVECDPAAGTFSLKATPI